MSSSDTPFPCVCECTHPPFKSQRALAVHRYSCSAWAAHLSVEAKRRRDGTPDNADTDSDEDPEIYFRKKSQKRQKLNVPNGSITTRHQILESAPAVLNFSSSPAPNVVMGIEIEVDPSPQSSMNAPAADSGMPDAGVAAEMSAAGRLLRSTRARRLPARYRDILPQGTAAVATTEPQETFLPAPAPWGSNIRRIILRFRDELITQINSFGLWREYPRRPSHDPDQEVGIEDLSNLPHQPTDSIDGSESSDSPLNPTQTLLTAWQNNGNPTKSNGEMNRLAEIIQRSEFRAEELQDYNAHTANSKITNRDENWDYNRLKDSFSETSLEIEVPSGDSNIPPKKFSIPQLLYRKPLAVIHVAFTDHLASKFHFSPFRLFQKIGDGAQRIRTDLYDSDAFLKAHDDIQLAPTDDKHCKREKVVAALMCWSDATQLANFGTAKLWPLYMLFGNLSKYIRVMPNSGAVHHLAYIPSIPDAIKHEISVFHTKWKTQSKEILTHCNRELMHAFWSFILDDEFVHAYHHGFVIQCFDGIERRIYPRFFTYSADYPEKVLLAGIRDLGACPCPRCLCPKSKLDQMGTRRDSKFRVTARQFLMDKVTLARRWIYHQGYKIKGSAVENILKETSSVPTINAFIDRLGTDFDLSQMLAVDFMHEFELGVWKALFTHLVRVLHAVNPELVEELDHRFRQIPSFGFDTIRVFANNASEMKKLAARDFEDLLQCSIPVFEGLIPEPFNSRLMKLLYRTAEWHALAKLRVQTDRTLETLQKLTEEFGKLMRQFRDLCNDNFQTFELPKEQVNRNRRNAEKAAAGGAVPNVQQGKRRKTLNLFTYKFHALGDYVSAISLFGPSDSFSTQLGELAHRVVKKLYSLGNKKKDPKQIGRRLRRIEWAKRAYDKRGIFTKRRRYQSSVDVGDATSLSKHYHIGQSGKTKHNINFEKTHSGDPAAKDFWPKLQDHLLGRLMGIEFDGDTHETFTDTDRNHIRVKNGQFISLQTLRINYTTYDVRRDQDSINPRTHADIMMHSPETKPGAHPYWYARVLGIFRASVISTHPKALTLSGPRDMEFLWVRWLGIDNSYRSGHQYARLPKVGFVEDLDPFAFGFLDPARVIRACHLMPSFSDGQTNQILHVSGPTRARNLGETQDWQFFYVGIFVDRDMYMRYFPGGGVGHVANWQFFQQSNEQGASPGDSGDDELDTDSDEESNSPPGLDASVNQQSPEDSADDFDEGEPPAEEEDTDKEEEEEEEEEEEDDGEDSWQWDDGYGSA
ncbi:hypothetical protein DFH05DRAFT_1528856 [Lentinula detonsa]|uniref:Uncharacterized protein n=1 Tax=Lentinula detonsa TaxID=2804962 RepID=A0A9W8NUA7_9AGAR|nr:hypothetical protein DFH05DRAFT_1528856 [Lentinula detonsa]